jgi:lactoylglutathione lyase
VSILKFNPIRIYVVRTERGYTENVVTAANAYLSDQRHISTPCSKILVSIMPRSAFAAPAVSHSIGSVLPFLGTAPTGRTRSLAVAPRLRRNFLTPVSPSGVRTTMSAKAGDALLHVVYRVGDLDRTREFFNVLGLKVLRERDMPEEKYTNVFVGAGSESNGKHVSLELTYNYGKESYNIGDGFGHFGIAVEDVAQMTEKLRGAGFKVVREPGPVKGGHTIIAFVEDPTGYKFELLQKKKRDPVAQITLRVGDLDKSIKFYEALGMRELSRRESEEGKYTNVKLGYGDDEDCTALQLTYNWGKTHYDNGDGYGQIAVRTKDVYEAAKIMERAGFKPAKNPGPVPGIGTKIVSFRDPDEWKAVLVDANDVSASTNSAITSCIQ